MSKYEQLNLIQVKTLIGYILDKDYDYAAEYLSCCLKSFSNTIEGDVYWRHYFYALKNRNENKITALASRLMRDKHLLEVEENSYSYSDTTFTFHTPPENIRSIYVNDLQSDISETYLFKAQQAITNHLMSQLAEINKDKTKDIDNQQQILSNLFIDGWS